MDRIRMRVRKECRSRLIYAWAGGDAQASLPFSTPWFQARSRRGQLRLRQQTRTFLIFRETDHPFLTKPLVLKDDVGPGQC